MCYQFRGVFSRRPQASNPIRSRNSVAPIKRPTIGVSEVGSVESSPKRRQTDLQEILYTRQARQPGKELMEIKRKLVSNPTLHASRYHLQAQARQESQAITYATKAT